VIGIALNNVNLMMCFCWLAEEGCGDDINGCLDVP